MLKDVRMEEEDDVDGTSASQMPLNTDDRKVAEVNLEMRANAGGFPEPGVDLQDGKCFVPVCELQSEIFRCCKESQHI